MTILLDRLRARPPATTEVRPSAPLAAVVVPPRAAVIRSRIPTLVGLASLAGFGVLYALVRVGRTAAFDAALTIRIQASRNPALNAVMRAASWPGFPPQSRVIQPLIIGSLAAAQLRVEAVGRGSWAGHDPWRAGTCGSSPRRSADPAFRAGTS